MLTRRVAASRALGVVAAAVAFGLGARDLAKDWLQSKTKTQPHPPEEEEEVFRHL